MNGGSPGGNDTSAYQNVYEADCDGDLDNDGLDDGWEVRNFGSVGQNSAGDPDNDGFTNLQEQLGGTNPNAYDSAFGMSATTRLKVFTPLK